LKKNNPKFGRAMKALDQIHAVNELLSQEFSATDSRESAQANLNARMVLMKLAEKISEEMRTHLGIARLTAL
jgi:hypothetical protein